MEKKEINLKIEDILKRNKNADYKCGYYIEDVHLEADKLLCKVLKDEGYDELVEWFESLEKWYS